MEPETQQLLHLVKELADGVLKLRIAIRDQGDRLSRLEHMITVDAIATQSLAAPSQSIICAQRDIIGEAL